MIDKNNWARVFFSFDAVRRLLMYKIFFDGAGIYRRAPVHHRHTCDRITHTRIVIFPR